MDLVSAFALTYSILLFASMFIPECVRNSVAAVAYSCLILIKYTTDHDSNEDSWPQNAHIALPFALHLAELKFIRAGICNLHS